ncbi:MAG: ParA family protein [Flavonifractor plautii]
MLIDADPQANATQSLLPPGEYNTLAGLLTIPDVYYDDLLYHSSIRGLDVLPADDELRNLDVDLLQGSGPTCGPSVTCGTRWRRMTPTTAS